MDGLYAFIFLAIICVIFMIARELWCWYWKINTIIENLNEISRKLNKE